MYRNIMMQSLAIARSLQPMRSFSTVRPLMMPSATSIHRSWNDTMSRNRGVSSSSLSSSSSSLSSLTSSRSSSLLLTPHRCWSTMSLWSTLAPRGPPTRSAPAASKPSRSILIYSTPLMFYMRAPTYVLLVLLSIVIFGHWPDIYTEYLYNKAEREARQAAIVSGEYRLPGVFDDHDEDAFAYSMRKPTFITPFFVQCMYVITAVIFTCVPVLARFNYRLIHSVRLYPRTRVLSIRTVNLFKVGRPQLMRLDGIVPPLARSGHPDSNWFHVYAPLQPLISEAQAEGGLDANAPKDGEQKMVKAHSYWLAPLPNSAASQSGLGEADAKVVEQLWSRLLTTNLHSEKQLAQIERIRSNE